MNGLGQFCFSTVGRKILMGLSGLLVVGFLIVHFIGNLFLYVGPEAFNRYAHALASNPLFPIAEILLALLFVWHVFLGINLYLTGKMARNESYSVKKYSGRGGTWASRTMPYTGSLILIFLFLHIWHFRLGPIYHIVYDGAEMRDLYRVVIEFFSSLPMTLLYLFFMLLIGLHLTHGFQSAFQSLGVMRERSTPIFKMVGYAVVIIVIIGFSSFPIWAYLKGGY